MSIAEPWDKHYVPWSEYEREHAKSWLTTFTCEPKPPTPNRPLPSKLKIKKIIFNGPATVVMWTDGTKTIVKCAKGELFDTEKAVSMAIWKKFLPEQYGRKAEKMICEAAGKALKSRSSRKKK